jgi:hypothetical protein
MEIDNELISEARRLIAGTNVHGIRTSIFYNETLPDSPRRKRYEKVLRDFVASVKPAQTGENKELSHVDLSRRVRLKSDALNRRMENS